MECGYQFPTEKLIDGGTHLVLRLPVDPEKGLSLRRLYVHGEVVLVERLGTQIPATNADDLSDLLLDLPVPEGEEEGRDHCGEEEKRD